MCWFSAPRRNKDLSARLDALEQNEWDLAVALLDYLRADMATPWMAPAKRLEALLMQQRDALLMQRVK